MMEDGISGAQSGGALSRSSSKRRVALRKGLLKIDNPLQRKQERLALYHLVLTQTRDGLPQERREGQTRRRWINLTAAYETCVEELEAIVGIALTKKGRLREVALEFTDSDVDSALGQRK